MLISGLQTLCGKNNEYQRPGETPRLRLCFLSKPILLRGSTPQASYTLRYGCVFPSVPTNRNTSPVEDPCVRSRLRLSQQSVFPWSGVSPFSSWFKLNSSLSPKFSLVTNATLATPTLRTLNTLLFGL